MHTTRKSYRFRYFLDALHQFAHMFDGNDTARYIYACYKIERRKYTRPSWFRIRRTYRHRI